MENAYLIAGVRTPIGKFLGVLRDLPATELGAIAIRETLNRAEIAPADVDEVIMGNVISAGLGQAPARQAALKAGLPHTVAALTVNKVCGSGLKAVLLAAQAVRLGDARVIVAGGRATEDVKAVHEDVGDQAGGCCPDEPGREQRQGTDPARVGSTRPKGGKVGLVGDVVQENARLDPARDGRGDVERVV
ncbi:MAG: hypothetical protein IID45_16110, partial [Planctomycetes bacterium]|nr:hypothetical protein [Planctomycetota bacterium]